MITLVLVAGVLLAFPVAAQAADVLINNGLDCSNPGNVIDHLTYQSDYVFVRNAGCGTPDPGSPCASPGAATEVCVEVGGEVYRLSPHDSSAVTINGGVVKGDGIWARDFSTVTINGGTLDGMIDAWGSSAVTINAGSLKETIWAGDFSTVTNNGGTVDAPAQLYGSSTFAMNGGTLEYVQLWDSATFTMRDGTVAGDLHAYEFSTVTMTGGTVQHFIWAYASSSVAMSGGSMIGLLAFGSSTITISGGPWQGGLGAVDSSTIEVMGTGFAVDGNRVSYGDLSAQTGTLTGRLASGDPMDNWLFNQGGGDYTGTITLAPPGYLVVPALSSSGRLLLAVALLGSAVVWRRRLR